MTNSVAIHPFTIITKSALIVRDLDLLADAAAQGLTPGETSHVRIAVQDGQIRISVNGAIALEGADPGPGKAGRVGFYVENYASLDFDDIGFSLSGVPVTGVSR